MRTFSWSDLQDCVRAFLVAFLAAAVLSWPIYRLLLRVGSRQNVSEHVPEHAKKQGTPTMGGLIILGGLLAGLAQQIAAGQTALLVAVYYLLGFGLIGFVDDYVVPRMYESKRGLGWMPKLVAQILLASLVPGMALLSGVDSNAVMRFSAEVFLILFFANAYNFADGMDALAGSLLIFFAAGAAVMGFLVDAQFTPILAALLIGAAVPFLFYNAPPAKVFMGDVGSLPIGALLGTMVVDLGTSAHRSGFSSGWAYGALAVLSIPMILELVPVPIQILAVKTIKRRVFAKTPIHHAFESKGVPETRIVWTFALIQIVCVALALQVLWMGGSTPVTK